MCVKTAVTHDKKINCMINTIKEINILTALLGTRGNWKLVLTITSSFAKK